MLWRSLAATRGDVLVFVDADLEQFCSSYVRGLLGPVLTDPRVALVKAVYEHLDGKATHGFTVGIIDDVTFTSIDYDPEFSTEDAKTVRGLFSATQIARQLGVQVGAGGVAEVFAEIESAVAAH